MGGFVARPWFAILAGRVVKVRKLFGWTVSRRCAAQGPTADPLRSQMTYGLELHGWTQYARNPSTKSEGHPSADASREPPI
jgi:hypothetical protein